MIQISTAMFAFLLIGNAVCLGLAIAFAILFWRDARRLQQLESKLEFWKTSYLDYQKKAEVEKQRADAAHTLAVSWAKRYEALQQETESIAQTAVLWNQAYRKKAGTDNDA